MLLIALSLLAAVPSLPSELASCDVWKIVDAEAANYCADCLRLEPAQVGGQAAFRFRTADGGIGRDAQHTTTQWIVYPKSCRMVGLEIESGGGSPVMSAAFVHGPKNTAPDPDEQELLRAWSEFATFDPRDPADQLAVASLASSSVRTGRMDARPGKQLVATSPLAMSWSHSKIVSQRMSWKAMNAKPAEDFGRDAACPCFTIFDGSLYRPSGEPVTAGGIRIQRFATQARNVTDAYAISDPKRGTSWIGPFTGPTTVFGFQHGRIWIRAPDSVNPGASLIAIDPVSGTYRGLLFPSGDAIEVKAITEKGIEVSNEYKGGSASFSWAQVDSVFSGK